MKKTYFIITIIIISIVTEIIVSPVRAFSVIVSSVTGFCAFLALTYFLLKKYAPTQPAYLICLAVLTGLLALNLPIRIYSRSTDGTLLDFLTHVLGIAAGYFTFYRQKAVHKVNLSVSVLIVLFVYFYGYDRWLFKRNYGTFTGEAHFKAPTLNLLKDANGQTVTLAKNKVTVLDFWFIGCGACMAEFPQYQKLYDQYKDNKNVQFYSIDVPTMRDKGANPIAYLKSFGYTFPMLISLDKKVAEDMTITNYPTIFIIDAKGDIIYKGDIETVKQRLEKML
ncbi:TlpA family protein disulfide reductase [Mucilaginibacter myungsuensis]|uniref:TlpA family protein disulfide reductase n=1 Tax=Mucilaginibacter myungsuensis TaxID=649104 RepID=A0A929KWH4_9SPHI|nr:TlpA disulfide reductase family protein [Mucilaginibacter myungsuensis]MBE9662904.1 TlpA family protein disulfide reductase [Mucilaginibacter myungsuensis]MDN3598524.1 TlpA disulfide reductase family protein [Mucilaginibacter myungsuensis]